MASGAPRLAHLLELAEASRAAGRHAAGCEQAREAAALAELLGDKPALTRAVTLLATHQLRLGHHEDCLATALTATALAEELGDDAALSAALNVAAMACDELDRTEEGLALAERSLEAAERCGDTLTLSWAHNRAGIVYRGATGVASLTLALSLAREAGDSEAIFSALNNLLEEHVDLVRAGGDPDERAVAQALAYGEEALELGRAAGNAHREAISLLNLAQAVALAGDEKRARRLLLSSTVISRREGFDPLLKVAQEALAALGPARPARES